MIALVCGSRSLADRAGAREWAIALIRQALESADLAVYGDARGPDDWADVVAHTRCMRARWSTSGHWLASWEREPRRWATREELDAVDARRVPLLRNAAMVDWVRERAAYQRVPLRWLALVDSDSATGGTGHTMGLLRGVEGRREVWTG